METINLRINYLAEKFFNGNNVRFAQKVESSEANIRNFRKNSIPKLEFVVKTCEILNVNFDWLLTGQGEMLRNAEETKIELTQKDNKYILSLEKNVELLEEKLQKCQEEKKIAANSKSNV